MYVYVSISAHGDYVGINLTLFSFWGLHACRKYPLLLSPHWLPPPPPDPPPLQNHDEIERTFFKKALSMCQDVDYPIRMAMCQQLGALARSMGREVTSKVLLEELVELLSDEELQVEAVGGQGTRAGHTLRQEGGAGHMQGGGGAGHTLRQAGVEGGRALAEAGRGGWGGAGQGCRAHGLSWEGVGAGCILLSMLSRCPAALI